MYHKLAVHDLRVGMYIVNTGVSWMQHPYLYAADGELTEQELANLLKQGFTEAYIDLSRCRPGTLAPELENLVPAVTEEDALPDYLPPPPLVSMAEELPKARVAFLSSLNMAKSMLDSVRAGVFDAPAAEPVV